jgi:threonine/homoserine/homoserine lactone efflux protein
MNFIIHLLLGTFLSFVGSIPAGMINVAVAETAMRRGRKRAHAMAWGASLVELIQAFVAVKFSTLLLQSDHLDLIFNWAALVIFLGLTVYYLFIAKPLQGPKIDDRPSKLPGFWQGVIISSLNVMVFPYWIFYGTYLSAQGWLDTGDRCILVFSVGTMIGTLLLLFLYARLGMYLLTRSERITKHLNRVLGLIFLGFFVYQVFQVF